MLKALFSSLMASPAQTAGKESLAPAGLPLRLNVGCGRNILDGWVNLDIAALPGVDIVADLDNCRESPLPFDDDSFDEFLLSHVIEHIRDPLALMQELHRIARPGARMVLRVPHGASDDAFEDPTHVRQYFHGSFGYFSQPFYWRADYGYRGDWLTGVIRLKVERTRFPDATAAEILVRINRERNVILEMEAELTAVKPARAPDRSLQVPPDIRIAFA
jgi:SAM-dependent methyltransferase